VKLTLRSTGGVTGAAGALVRTVDLDGLPATLQARGRALVAAAKLFALPARLLLSAPKPWDFRYQLEVEDGGQSHRIDLHLDAGNGALRALIEWLESESEPVHDTNPPRP
jgi:hypothetical protein